MGIIEEVEHQTRAGIRHEVVAGRLRMHKLVRLRFGFSELVLLAMVLALAIVSARHFLGDPASRPLTRPLVKTAPPNVDVFVAGNEAPANIAGTKSEAVTEVEVVAAKVKHWANAWGNRDVEGYLAHYSDTYQPGDGLTHQQWLAQRRLRLGRQSVAEIEITGLRILREGQDRATAQFTQNFNSVGFNEVGTVKELEMRRVGDGWKIIGERILTAGKKR